MSKNVLRLVVTADGRVATRTFDEVGAASGRTAGKVERDAKKQEAAFAGVERGTHRMQGAVGSLMGTVGLGGLALGIADVVKSGEQWQLQQAQLADALKSTGQYSKELMDRIRGSAEAMSVKGGFAGPEQIAAITQFIRLTGSASRALQLNRDAMNLARIPGVGYGQAQKMIGQILTGNTGRLQRYLGIIQPVKTAEYALSQSHKVNVMQLAAQSKALGKLGPQWLRQQEIIHGLTPAMMQHAQLLDRQATAQEALDRIQTKYGNNMKTFSGTTAGAVSNLKNRFDLLGETIGRKILPVVSAVVGWMSRHTTIVFGLVAALTVLGLTYGAVTAATALWGAAMTVSGLVAATAEYGMAGLRGALWLLGAGFEAMGVEAAAGWAMATLGISVLVAGLVYALTHWKQTKKVVMDVWNWIKGHWPLLAEIIAAPFTLGLSLILPHLGLIKTAAGNVVSFIGRLFNTGVGRVIAAPFTFAWGIIKDVANWIVGAFHWVVKRVEAMFHTITSPIRDTIGALNDVGGAVSGLSPFAASKGQIARAAASSPDAAARLRSFGINVPQTIRRSSVQQITTNNNNSVNPAATQASGDQGANIVLHHTTQIGSRVVTHETVHFSARQNALSGRLAVNPG